MKIRMKNSTIRKRVTLYYSLALIMITLLVFSVFLATASRQVTAVSKDTVMKAVQNSFDDIEFENNIIEIDDDFDAYSKGVILLVYGENGNLIKGSVPKKFPAYTPLSTGNYEEIETEDSIWITYDLYNTYDNGQGLWVRGIYAMDNSVETLRTIIVLMIFSLPIILLIAIWAGMRITKRAFDPIKEITDAANSINSGNDLSKRLPQGESKDELYFLTETLNQMMERLESAFLAEKQFTSDVSHELKTPIAVVLSECEYVLQENRRAEEYVESIETIQKQCRRTMSLIQQLLQLSRTFNKANAVEKEIFNLSLLAESIAEELEKMACEKGVLLQTDIQPDVEFYGDETLILRLIMNLLTNGIKYSRNIDEAYVRLTISSDEKEVKIIAEDNGIGIKKEDLELVFHRFYKVDQSRTAKENSFGLGLSMVKWIAEAHNGSVALESEPEKGSAFIVTLPQESHL